VTAQIHSKALVQSQSFCTFLHSFRFDPDYYNSIVELVKADTLKGSPIWRVHRFQNEDLLPHVANFLNISNESNDSSQNGAITHSWDMDLDVLGNQEWMGAKGRWSWKPSGAKEDIEIQLTEVNLTLFRTGLGLLRFHCVPTTQELETWQDFLHHFRFIEGRRSGYIKARRKIGKEQWDAFLPGLLAKANREPPESLEFQFGELVYALEHRYLGEHPRRGVYIQGQTIPYAGVFIEGLPLDQQLWSLYRMKNFFRANQSLDPAPNEVSLPNEDYFQYSASSWFIFSLDGAGFVAFDAPNTPFYQETLPSHLLNDQYHLLFMLVQQQRLLLMDLSEEVAGYWKEQDLDLQKVRFDRLRDRLLFFTANGYFIQVMQREHHHRIYRMWQSKLQIHDLYREVAGEIRDIHERSLLRIQEGANRYASRLNTILFILGPVAVAIGITQAVAGYLSLSIPITKASLKLPLMIGGGALSAGLGLGLCLALLLHRQYKRGAKKTTRHSKFIVD